MKEGGNRKEQWEQQRTRMESELLNYFDKIEKEKTWAVSVVGDGKKAKIQRAIIDSSMCEDCNVMGS
jgi:hypothetical protein